MAAETNAAEIGTTSSKFDDGRYELWRKSLREILGRHDEDEYPDVSINGPCVASDPLPQMAPLPMHPAVSVAGLGRIALPFSAGQAESLKRIARGASEKSGNDSSSDSYFELAAPNVSVGGSKWDKSLTEITKTALETMGLQEDTIMKSRIEARLHGLLLFEVGSDAKSWDSPTKRSDKDVIGTILIQLPSRFEGGQLEMTRFCENLGIKDESVTVDQAKDSEESFYYTAFLSPIKYQPGFKTEFHQHLSPIQSGRRLCLMYDLIVTTGPPKESFFVDNYLAWNTHEVCKHRMRQIAESWDVSCPTKQSTQACLLKGNYTANNLSFRNLSDFDADIVRLLRESCDSMGKPLFGVALLLVRKEEVFRKDRRPTTSESYRSEIWVSTEGDRVEPCSFGLDQMKSSLLQLTKEESSLSSVAFEEESRHCSGTTLSFYTQEKPLVHGRSMVVFWPQEKNVEVSCRISFSLALLALKSETTKAGAMKRAERVLDLIEDQNVFLEEEEGEEVDEYNSRSHPAQHTLEVLQSFGRDASPLVARTIHLITKSCKMKCGGVVDAMADAVTRMSSDSVDDAMEKCLKASVADCPSVWHYSYRVGCHPGGKERAINAKSILVSSAMASLDEMMRNEKVAVNFVDAVDRSKRLSPEMVEGILKCAKPEILSAIVQERWKTASAGLQQLREKRLEQVKLEMTADIAFSWCQPDATFPHYEEHSVDVLRFLHGPDQVTCIGGFKETKDACQWGELHFKILPESKVKDHKYSALYDAYTYDDEGLCHVRITKTKEIPLANLKLKKKALKKEKADLEKALGVDTLSSKPPTKRRRRS